MALSALTDTSGLLLVQAVASSTVWDIPLASKGAIGVDTGLPSRTRSGKSQTFINICRNTATALKGKGETKERKKKSSTAAENMACKSKTPSMGIAHKHSHNYDKKNSK